MDVKTKKTVKRAVVITAAVAGVGAGIYGGLVAYRQSSKKPVRVYPVQYIAQTSDMMGMDSDQWYGSVTASNIQSVFISGTQQVKQILVTEGQEVKTKDPLIAYDTTLSAIKVEKAENDLKKQQLELKKAQEELQELLKLKPGQAAKPADSSRVIEANELSAGEDTAFFTADNDFEGNGFETAEGDAESPADPAESSTGAEDLQLKILSGTGTYMNPYVIFITSGQEITEDQLKTLFAPSPVQIGTEPPMPNLGQGEDTTAFAGKDEEYPSEETAEGEGETLEEGKVYAIFREFKHDDPSGTRKEDHGMLITMREGKLAYRWLNLTSSEDPGGDTPGGGDDPGSWDEPGGGDNPGGGESDHVYTKEELEKLRNEKRKEIRDLTLKTRLAEISVREMKEEVSDGLVRSKVDGVVTNVKDPNEAYKNNQPVLTVTAGDGGYDISVEVGELSLDKVKAGDSVNIQDFETGGMYEGSVEKVSDLPSANSGWSGGNPNVSYYTCTVRAGADADLKDGSYVQVTRDQMADTGDGNLYIDKMMVRKDGSQSYIYVLGSDGKLVRRNIVTGKILYGSVVEVKKGISMDDYIAFPYGKDVENGAETKKMEDVNSLYSGEE